MLGAWFGLFCGMVEGLGLLAFQRINWLNAGRMIHEAEKFCGCRHSSISCCSSLSAWSATLWHASCTKTAVVTDCHLPFAALPSMTGFYLTERLYNIRLSF